MHYFELLLHYKKQQPQVVNLKTFIMPNDILIGTYKILRKLGAKRNEIKPETAFEDDLFFDETDKTCLLFFVESNFHFQFTPNEEKKLRTINDLVQVIYNHKQHV